MGRSQPLQLLVDPVRHAEELARFETHVVRGPGPDDCAIWAASVGSDSYGRFWVRRGGARIMVRPNRYALAASLEGRPLAPWVRALHGCDNPACVRVSMPGDVGLLHIVGGTQRDNMVMMARAGRGGGRVPIRQGDNGLRARRERAVALREAVRHGWDAAAVSAALLGSNDPTLW